MEINKAAQAASSGAPTAVQLEAINNLAKAHLTAQQVYVFSLRLCDDQVDRDFERFDSAALPGLAKLFIGKTGIVDHKWSSDNQVARIFQTEVVREDGAEFIKAWAYIRRGDANDEIIADIEAGIKRRYPWGAPWGAPYAPSAGATTVPAGIGRARAMTDRSAAPFYRSRWTPTSFPLWPSRHSGRPGC